MSTDETLTIWTVQPLGFGNLNRDEDGLPKTVNILGTMRGMLSPQSLKRAARVAYEERTNHPTYRSRELGEVIAMRAMELNPDLGEDKARKETKKHLDKFGTDTSIWLSPDEIEAAALFVAEGGEGELPFSRGKSASLSIAAFGRMMASATEAGVSAAVSVSPLIASHETDFSYDFFTTVDDLAPESNKGAAFLGSSVWTSMVGVRGITINRSQLRRSWTGIDSESAPELVGVLVRELIRQLPKGKTNSSQPTQRPEIVYAQIDGTPGNPAPHAVPTTEAVEYGENGYVAATIDMLANYAKTIRAEDEADGNSADHWVAGVAPESAKAKFGCDVVTTAELVDRITEWVLEDVGA